MYQERPHCNHTSKATARAPDGYKREARISATYTEVIDETNPTSAQLQERQIQQEKRPVTRQLMEGKVKCLASPKGAGHVSRLGGTFSLFYSGEYFHLLFCSFFLLVRFAVV